MMPTAVTEQSSTFYVIPFTGVYYCIMPKRLHLEAHLSSPELERYYRKARDPVERTHLHIIWLLSRGRRTREVAEATGYSLGWTVRLRGATTLAEWLGWATVAITTRGAARGPSCRRSNTTHWLPSLSNQLRMEACGTVATWPLGSRHRSASRCGCSAAGST